MPAVLIVLLYAGLKAASSAYPAWRDATEAIEHAGTWIGALVLLGAGYIANRQLMDTWRATRAEEFSRVIEAYETIRPSRRRLLLLKGGKPLGASDLVDPDDNAAALVVLRYFEHVGTLLRFGGIDFLIVDSYFHNRIIETYELLLPNIKERRQQIKRDSWKYFEYLYIRCRLDGPIGDKLLQEQRARFERIQSKGDVKSTEAAPSGVGAERDSESRHADSTAQQLT